MASVCPASSSFKTRVEYDTRTHHSNQDVFDRIQADDMKQSSVIMAAFVYNTAMLDEKLPRKPLPASNSQGPGAQWESRGCTLIINPHMPRLRPSTMMQERASALSITRSEGRPSPHTQGRGHDGSGSWFSSNTVPVDSYCPENRCTDWARPYSNFSTGVPISPTQSAPLHVNAF